ncbi:contractile injection system protein, VgrG/Pvc8 family [Pseudomonas sp. 21LCFQ02]|uniref:contractile injection system protein, VgrG/Pvc8 family n=1 Tax=Pseudomonas sp. 21LCFQ02 TaxID=2957505 RepID=UPI00209B28ED|nr:contractile injection system protein, VgrG/Pvc8 family [Pseudomonas sp. 21LCFQ02]MCO8169804.1 contractile injection system protein, VgrG/Pvc8 family [Pseudomonas sp. 21LCFQ02]
MTDSSTYRLDVAGLHEPLAVASFFGTEAISRPFVFELTLGEGYFHISAEQLMYRSAFLALGAAGAGLHGQIQSVQRCVQGTGVVCYRLTLGPRLACLAQRYTPRVFQDMSATQIITQVLSEHGIGTDSHRFHLQEPCATRAFCAQYLENDLQLLQRLCAEEGIHYHFVHARQNHQLVFGSGLFGARRMAPAPCCEDRQSAGVSDFTLTGPQAGRRRDGEGRSTLMALGCGQLLPLTGHPRAECNQLWRVVQVEHHGESFYSNRFVVRSWEAPVHVPAVPPVSFPALLRAWVVGLDGQLAERDARGRVRVQFDWVMQGEGARFADCWLPVQAAVQVPLCGGMPVLVSPSSEAGREPLVIACLHDQAPETAPEHVEAHFPIDWLTGAQDRLWLQNGQQLQLAAGARLTLQVGASRLHLDDDGLILSAPRLSFSPSVGEPAIAAVQAPGNDPKGQATQQHEQQEGQP